MTMCTQCERLSRRSIFAAGAGLVATLASGGPSRAAGGPTTELSADQALARLVEGNRRFMTAPEACAANLAQSRTALTGHQAPFAIIMSCSDSRVPPELVFGGMSLGELFVVRTAGAVVDRAALGTIEYGVAVLKAPLLVVLGHQSCGAVAAACEVVANDTRFPGAIGELIQPLLPAAIAARGQAGDFVDNAVRESVKRQVAHLKAAGPVITAAIADGKLRVVGARYDLASGAVEYIA
jgi:carbonic anhydrase